MCEISKLEKFPNSNGSVSVKKIFIKFRKFYQKKYFPRDYEITFFGWVSKYYWTSLFICFLILNGMVPNIIPFLEVFSPEYLKILTIPLFSFGIVFLLLIVLDIAGKKKMESFGYKNKTSKTITERLYLMSDLYIQYFMMNSSFILFTSISSILMIFPSEFVTGNCRFYFIPVLLLASHNYYSFQNFIISNISFIKRNENLRRFKFFYYWINQILSFIFYITWNFTVVMISCKLDQRFKWIHWTIIISIFSFSLFFLCILIIFNTIIYTKTKQFNIQVSNRMNISIEEYFRTLPLASLIILIFLFFPMVSIGLTLDGYRSYVMFMFNCIFFVINTLMFVFSLLFTILFFFIYYLWKKRFY
jgi:hypothetical protein